MSTAGTCCRLSFIANSKVWTIHGNRHAVNSSASCSGSSFSLSSPKNSANSLSICCSTFSSSFSFCVFSSLRLAGDMQQKNVKSFNHVSYIISNLIMQEKSFDNLHDGLVHHMQLKFLQTLLPYSRPYAVLQNVYKQPS